MLLDIDGQDAWVDLAQPMARYGLIYLGEAWHDHISAKLPADKENGRPGQRIVKGATDDTVVLGLYKAWFLEVNGVEFDKVAL